ncbi:PorP/SprF family type IX secretion system membrane protein [Epilithonimonas sp. UC225_85]|uniref:PorP/SprF family type IX secretion system membrane protein n=1 Tax=Epilithonimonas sp. UC225_85 TaxID=3350167 RepID=UPI0036D2B52C
MKKNYLSYKIFPLLIALFSIGAKAQETLPFYQQYLVDGDFLFNPALLGKTDDVVLNLNYQKQFSQLSESPNVQSIGLHANVFDRVGAGIAFFRDQNGPISSNGLMLGASYFVPLSDEDDRQDQFSFGVGTNLYNMNIDYTKVVAEQQGDQVLGENTNDIFIAYANLGAAVKYRNLFAGASVIDIPISNDIPIVNGIEPSPTKYYLNVGYDWHFTDGIFLTPSFMMNLNTNSARIFDYNLMATAFGERNNISAGISFRKAKSAVGSENIGMSPIIKGRVGGVTFGAVYNFGVSELTENFGNSFMLSLGFNIDNFINTRGFRYR